MSRRVGLEESGCVFKTFEARRDGFELSFTKKVDRASGSAASSYQLSSYTYTYHRMYGSEEIDIKQPAVRSATVSPDGLRVRLKIDGLREGYVHELRARRPIGRRREASAPSGLLHLESNPGLNSTHGRTNNARARDHRSKEYLFEIDCSAPPLRVGPRHGAAGSVVTEAAGSDS